MGSKQIYFETRTCQEEQLQVPGDYAQEPVIETLYVQKALFRRSLRAIRTAT